MFLSLEFTLFKDCWLAMLTILALVSTPVDDWANYYSLNLDAREVTPFFVELAEIPVIF